VYRDCRGKRKSTPTIACLLPLGRTRLSQTPELLRSYGISKAVPNMDRHGMKVEKAVCPSGEYSTIYLHKKYY
jgi:hypothetical protein